MPAYGFAQTRGHPPGRSWATDCLRCDLARPADELKVLAAIVSAAYVFDAWVIDAALHLRLHSGDCDAPEVVERLARWHVDAARAALAQVLSAPDPLSASLLASPRTWPDAVQLELHRTPDRYDVPEGYGGEACFVHVEDEGGLPVSWYIHDYTTPRGLPEAVAGMVGLLCGRSAQTEEWPLRISVERRHFDFNTAWNFANAALRMAKAALAAGKARIKALPAKGEPSMFTPEDNDARDILLAAVVVGASVDVVVPENRDGWICTLQGEPVPEYLVRRLLSARWLESTERGWSTATSFVLSGYAPKATPRQLAPREHAVSFAAFASWCRYKGHTDDARECGHPKKWDADNCGVHGCPLVTPVYRHEVSSADEDPVFGWTDESLDVMVTADDVRTERSAAWRAAGRQRVEAIVNLVAGSYLRYNASFICDEALAKAAREAVEQGHLEIVEETTLGPIVRLGAVLKDRCDAMRAQQQGAQA